MMKPVEPIGYDIKTTLLHIHDGTPIWRLDYKEYFPADEWTKEARDNTVTLLEKVDIRLVVDDEENSVSYSVQGPKRMIVDMLTGEFLAMSSIAEVTMQQLFILIGKLTAESGRKLNTETGKVESAKGGTE